MQTKNTLPFIALLLGVASAPATAQVTVSPTAGWYVPVQNLERVTEGSGSVAVRRQSSPMLGFTVERKFRNSPVSARGQVSYAAGGNLVAKRLTGEESCGTDCTRYLYSDERLSSSSALLLVADAVVRGQAGRLRPYVAAGGGVRRYGFAQSELEGEFATAFSEDVSRFVAHVGAGLEGTVRSLTAQIEVGDYFGHYSRSGSASNPAIGMQHDLAVSFGLRLTLP